MTYGIPSSIIPVADSGKMKTENHKKWLARRTAKDNHLKMALAAAKYGNDTSSSTLPVYGFSGTKYGFEGIDFPNPNDVLLGRGKPFRDHTGNVRLRHIVEQYREEYDSKEVPGQKAEMAEVVIKIIGNSEPAGRFLKLHPDHGWWIHASRDETIEKIRQSFRTARSAATTQTSDGVAAAARSGTKPKRVKISSMTKQINPSHHFPNNQDVFFNHDDGCFGECYNNDHKKVTM